MRHHQLVSRTSYTLLLFVSLLSATSVRAQSTTAGWTPAGIAPGAPAGAYPLSDLESTNLYNGHLSANLPLFTMRGRGEDGFTSSLNITPVSWIVESQLYYYIICSNEQTCETWWYEVHTPSPDPDAWISDPGYGPGVLYFRRSGSNVEPNASDQLMYGTHLTRLTFTMPDGTQVEFIDQTNEGRVLGYESDERDRIWTTRDGGVSATFISDQPIYDWYYYEPPVPLPEILGATGDLHLKSGVRYRVENGLVKWMRDRNGNKTTFEYTIDGRIIKATDSFNRELTFLYSVNEGLPYGVCDKITYKGTGGAPRSVRISRTNLSNVLRSGYSIQTYQQLFPELYGTSTQAFNPGGCSFRSLATGRAQLSI